MDSPTAASSPAPKPKQPLVARLGFFVVGGVASTSINNGILDIAQSHFHQSVNVGYAISTASTAIIFFLWSYFINFRTSIVWKNCLGRYVAVVLIALLINYLLGRAGLKHYNSSNWIVRFLVIGVVQSVTGGIKFLLYHFWVFPHAEAPSEPPDHPAAAIS